MAGFGGDGYETDVYCIDNFKIKSDINSDYIEINHLYIACTDNENINWNLILPATIFTHTSYEINNLDNNPQLIIKHPKTYMHVELKRNIYNSNIMGSVYSFVQYRDDKL